MTLTKLEVATRQLDVAIRLFLEGDYLSSLTLAGAAEEILGRLSEKAGLPVAVDQIAKFHWDDMDASLQESERKRILLRVLNGPRNSAKHANDPEEAEFDVDPDFSLQMIMRAMPMARSLGSPLSREDDMVRIVSNYLRGVMTCDRP